MTTDSGETPTTTPADGRRVHGATRAAPPAANGAPAGGSERGAIARTVVMIVGVALLSVGFVLSYLGAFHDPTPHRVPLALVAPAEVSGQLVDDINAIPGRPLEATAVDDESTARRQLERAETDGVLIIDTSGTQDTLLVASGGTETLATAVERVVTAAEDTRQRTVTVEDVVPSQRGDEQGLSVFYLVIGAVLAGYLYSAVLGFLRGSHPVTAHSILVQLIAAVPYVAVVGLGMAIVTDPVLGALTGHFVALWVVCALLALASASVTIALEAFFGVIGIGVTILIFVVVGNASAGGAFPYQLTPPFWRTVGPWLPNGAGVDVLRRVIYFDAVGITGPVLVIAAWIVGGILFCMLATAYRRRRPAPDVPSTDPA